MNCKIIKLSAELKEDNVNHFAEIELSNGEKTTAEITEKTYFELLEKMKEN